MTCFIQRDLLASPASGKGAPGNHVTAGPSIDLASGSAWPHKWSGRGAQRQTMKEPVNTGKSLVLVLD